MKDDVFGLFPIPVMRCPGVLPPALVAALADHFSRQAREPNNSSEALAHTRMLQPADSPLLVEAAARLTPKIAEFGQLLFGEALPWAIKEMWVNVLDNGGRQAMHNHANSFASGVVYLTETDDSARTVFMKSPGGHEFSIKNDHAGVVTGPSAFALVLALGACKSEETSSSSSGGTTSSSSSSGGGTGGSGGSSGSGGDAPHGNYYSCTAARDRPRTARGWPWVSASTGTRLSGRSA